MYRRLSGRWNCAWQDCLILSKEKKKEEKLCDLKAELCKCLESDIFFLWLCISSVNSSGFLSSLSFPSFIAVLNHKECVGFLLLLLLFYRMNYISLGFLKEVRDLKINSI